MLELLAKLKVNKWVQLPTLIHQIERERNVGSAVIVLKPELEPEDWVALRRLDRQGFRVWVTKLTEQGSLLEPFSTGFKRKEAAANVQSPSVGRDVS